MTWSGKLKKLVFGISPEEATFARRGFHTSKDGAQARLEDIGRTFIRGYLTSLQWDNPADCAAQLEGVSEEMRGFAYEGAGMGFALQDILLPGSTRLARFVAGPAAKHTYIVHVGAGWAWARLGFGYGRQRDRMDSLLRWLAYDGFGFHETYFKPRQIIEEHRRPARLGAYALRGFDQGVGRAMWFACGMEVDRIIDAVEGFAPERRPDLWSGLGLATTYAGGADAAEVRALLDAAGPSAADYAQGLAFAAEARRRAGFVPDGARTMCERVWGVELDRVADATQTPLADLPPDADVPSFEIWRARIRDAYRSLQHPARPAARDVPELELQSPA